MPITDDYLRLAVKNVAEFGDTDVFPFPLENQWFSDKPDVVLGELCKIRDNYEGSLQRMPVFYSTELTNTGYVGFRAATQIDPLWNAFFLAATISVAAEVEKFRQPHDRVFSYRFSPDESSGALFGPVGWKDFHEKGLELSNDFNHVAQVDISDFYSRIYHHRLENVLSAVCKSEPEIVKLIDDFLRKLNSGNSFGLPVGGPASRILAEALLIRTDRLLETKRVSFLRFVDDYMIFGENEDDVRRSLLTLSRLLLDNEGLTLNRNKTRLVTADEFRRQSVFADPGHADSQEEQAKREFFSIHLRFDPYSPTAEEDFESLRKAVRKHDVLGMLRRELEKSRLDRFAVGQLVKSMRFMDENDRTNAVLTLADNLPLLAPVFPTVAIAFRKIRSEIDEDAAQTFHDRVRAFVEERSPLIGASGTLSFAIRVLADDAKSDAEITLESIFESSRRTPIVEREIILAMTKRQANFWLSDARSRFANFNNPWSKRALLAGSFVLGDEGKHWRKSVRKLLPDHDRALLDWMSDKNSGCSWKLPT